MQIARQRLHAGRLPQGESDLTIVSIYGLVDPRDCSLRYVGKTVGKLKARLSGHISDVRRGHLDGLRFKWVAEVLASGRSPEIFLLEEADEYSWVEAEQFWIAYGKFVGCQLSNASLGGSGRQPHAARFKGCAVAGCSGNAHYTARGVGGLCNAHNIRLKRRGNLSTSRASAGEGLAWLLAHLDHADIGACLRWPFGTDGYGYGRVTYGGRQTKAHRVMCELVHGPAPSTGLDAAHSCGRGHEGCVNPHHLRWATRTENFADKKRHGTLSIGERNWNAALKSIDVIEVRRLLDSQSNVNIAARYGVAPRTISDIRSGATWGWLQERKKGDCNQEKS